MKSLITTCPCLPLMSEYIGMRLRIVRPTRSGVKSWSMSATYERVIGIRLRGDDICEAFLQRGVWGFAYTFGTARMGLRACGWRFITCFRRCDIIFQATEMPIMVYKSFLKLPTTRAHVSNFTPPHTILPSRSCLPFHSSQAVVSTLNPPSHLHTLLVSRQDLPPCTSHT